MSNHKQKFVPRCNYCKRKRRDNYWNLVVIRITPSGGIVARCEGCGRITTRYSRAARRYLAPLQEAPLP